MTYTQKSFSSILFIIIFLGITACTPQDAPAAVIEIDNPPTQTPIIIYVTPTTAPTALSTVALNTALPTTTLTPAPTNTPDLSQAFAQCQTEITYLYTQASDACLGQPNGY